MGKIEVYKRQYKKKERENYYTLIKEIKDNSFDASDEERRYFTFDGKVLVKISPDFSTSTYNNLSSARIAIEKIGPTANDKSEIEKLLLNEGFKRVTGQE
jgi:hypothetical protein